MLDDDECFEAWARWCAGGNLLPSAESILSKLANSKGEIIMGSGGGFTPYDCLESTIEATVMKLAANPKTLLMADCLRLEYCAGWFSVSRRRNLPRNFSPYNVSQLQIALHLGISVRTYCRHLEKGRNLAIRAIQSNKVKNSEK